ncbi:alpha/beta hydrolase [Leifsonia shinshuensis]|uniref:alpha/beta hydrolase n=1 Tax=Leifsonia shinshuensis TaxID=150026 RepID=UPI001F514077|nr:alpha/beta hydrolase-fold protein [Leifsonia shinshuensis]
MSQDAVDYAYGPDSTPQPGVVPGVVEQLRLSESERFPGTSRSVWLHRPAGLSAETDCAVMFFTDGWWYLDPAGDVRGGIVLDNLAARGELPPMVGVFVDPGVLAGEDPPAKNRNAEYDAFDDRFASFLLEEVLPLVEERFAVSSDPMMRGICGGSSGGNAALTAVWTRPDAFGRAITFNASFAQLPGGNPYPALAGTGSPRGFRAFLHAAHRDLNWNRREDNWFAENLETAAAFARAGYDIRLAVGDGGHSPNHGGVLLPDALRWLWNAPSGVSGV